VEIISYVDGKGAREIKFRIAMAKAAFKTFYQQIGLKFEELIKCYIWSVACYGAEILVVYKCPS
jgi:hypothetical protein